MREIAIVKKDIDYLPVELNDYKELIEQEDTFVVVSVVRRTPGKKMSANFYHKLMRDLIRINGLGSSTWTSKKRGYEFDFNKHTYTLLGKKIYLTPSEELSMYLVLCTGVKTDTLSKQVTDMRGRLGLQFLRGML